MKLTLILLLFFCFSCGTTETKLNCKDGRECYQKALSHISSPSSDEEGRLLKLKKASTFLKTGCDFKHAQSCFQLGSYLFYIEKKHEIAILHFKQACQLGDKKACEKIKECLTGTASYGCFTK
jgi:TPR repeat protein